MAAKESKNEFALAFFASASRGRKKETAAVWMAAMRESQRATSRKVGRRTISKSRGRKGLLFFRLFKVEDVVSEMAGQYENQPSTWKGEEKKG